MDGSEVQKTDLKYPAGWARGNWNGWGEGWALILRLHFLTRLYDHVVMSCFAYNELYDNEKYLNCLYSLR